MVFDEELRLLSQEAREALAAPWHEKVSRAFEVLPKVVSALDRAAEFHEELRAIQAELTAAVRSFRERVWEAQALDPDLHLNNAKVHKALSKLNQIMQRLENLLVPDDA